MADVPPLLPDDQDVKHLTDYLNFQKQLTDAYKQDLEIMDKIGHIDRNLETSLKKKIELQKDYLQKHDKLQRDLKSESDLFLKTAKENRTEIAHKIQSLKEESAAHRDIIASLQQQVQFEMAAAEHRHNEETKYHTLITSMFSKITGFQNKHLATYKEIYDQINKSVYGISKYAGVIAAVLVVLKHAYDTFVLFDKAAMDFRMEMGMTRENAKGIRGEVEKVAIEFMHVGVNIKGAYDAFSALGKEAGSVFAVTSDMVKTTALLKSQLGVSEENSAGFLKNMAAVSKSTMQTQQDMAYVAADMAQAAGVPLNQIMSDVGKASGNTLTMMSRVPNQVLRSAIELRKMGTSLKEAANSSKEILNFSDSINAEMEASVLLGRSINLQRARELAYRRDLEGSTKEILRITKSIDFQNMDVFQQEAFARATGKSVDELLRMVQAERQWEMARNDPTLGSKVSAYEKLHQSVEAETKARGQNLALMIEQKANQDSLTSISNKWNQIMTQAGALFLPIIDFVLAIAIPAMDIAQGLFGWVVSIRAVGESIAGIALGFTKMFSGSLKIFDFFVKIQRFGVGIVEFIAMIGSKISPMFKFLGIFGGTFGKAIPILGEVIMALQFIWNFGKRIIAIWNDPNMNIGEKILAGLTAVVGALYDTLIQPFADAWNWITGFFGGHSPSELGLSIVRGLVSVGGMIYDAITYPFRHAMAWIADKIPGMGKMAAGLRGGVGDLINKPVEQKASAAYVSAATVTADGVNVYGKPNDKTPTPSVETRPREESVDNKTLQDILGAINALNNNLSSGKIGIYLDGQLVSATIARQTEFRGGYGVNKVA